MNTRLSKRLDSLPASIWTLITHIDELKGKWTGSSRLSPYNLRQLKRSVLVTSTGASTRIEGSSMTDKDIEMMLRGLSLQTMSDRDAQEVRGYYELLQNVFDSWQDISLSESTIKHFHQELLKYALKDNFHRGQYKQGENKVEMINERGESIGTLFDTTPAYLTPVQMTELVQWTRESLDLKTHHPLLVISNYIVEFLQIHPFTDGNGRLSRILTNLLLLKSDYLFVPYISHEKLIEDNKAEYYVALRTSQNTFGSDAETILPWLTFFLRIVLKQSTMAIELFSSESFEKLLSPNQIAVWRYIQSVSEASPGDIARATNVTRPTVSQVVRKLLEHKKIEKIGAGRTTRYRLVSTQY